MGMVGGAETGVDGTTGKGVDDEKGRGVDEGVGADEILAGGDAASDVESGVKAGEGSADGVEATDGQPHELGNHDQNARRSSGFSRRRLSGAPIIRAACKRNMIETFRGNAEGRSIAQEDVKELYIML